MAMEIINEIDDVIMAMVLSLENQRRLMLSYDRIPAGSCPRPRKAHITVVELEPMGHVSSLVY